MAVVDVKEGWKKRDAGRRTKERHGTRHFTVLCDDLADDPDTALQAAGIPRRGDPHPKDHWRKAISVQAKQRAPCYFEVTVQYTADESGTSQDDDQKSPLEELAEIEVRYVYVTEDADTDIEGYLLGTACTEPYDGITTERALRQIEVTRNLADFDPKMTDAWEDSVNEDVFLGHEPHTVKCGGIRATRIAVPELVYWRTTGVFTFNRAKDDSGVYGWKRRIVHEGFWTWARDDDGNPIKDGDGWLLDVILDGQGMPKTKPTLLDLRGDPIPPTRDIRGVKPTFRYFQMKREMVFGELHFFK